MLSGRDCREGRASACRGVGFELGELCAQGLNEQLSLLGRMSACRSVEFKPGELCALRLNEQLVPLFEFLVFLELA